MTAAVSVYTGKLAVRDQMNIMEIKNGMKNR